MVISRRSLLKYGLCGLATSQLGGWPEFQGVAKAGSFEAPRNCLFIVLDAASARNFQPWGYGRKTTPNIASLADSGFVFRSAFSQASETIPSVRSYLTGFYQQENRIKINRIEIVLPSLEDVFISMVEEERVKVLAEFEDQEAENR